MGTRFSGQIPVPSVLRQENASEAQDVWISQRSVIADWGLDAADLWSRVLERSQEVLVTGGIQARLYQQLETGILCTCRKEETGQLEPACPVCYGTGYVGGYELYGHSTIAQSAINDWQLSNLMVDVSQRVPRLVLPSGIDSGTAVSPEFYISNSFGFTGFNLKAKDGPRTNSTTLVNVQYTVDGGQNWYPMSDPSLLNDSHFIVQFRVQMTRPKGNPSPYFQILRARFQMSRFTSIIVSKRMFPEQRLLESIGVRVKMDGITWWTTPNAGNTGGDVVRIRESDIMEVMEGIHQAEDGDYPTSGRYKPSTVSYVEPAGHFISQRFNMRPLQTDEVEEVF